MSTPTNSHDTRWISSSLPLYTIAKLKKLDAPPPSRALSSLKPVSPKPHSITELTRKGKENPVPPASTPPNYIRRQSTALPQDSFSTAFGVGVGRLTGSGLTPRIPPRLALLAWSVGRRGGAFFFPPCCGSLIRVPSDQIICVQVPRTKYCTIYGPNAVQKRGVRNPILRWLDTCMVFHTHARTVLKWVT